MIILGSSVWKSISQTCNPFETSSGLSGGKGRTHTVGLQSNFVRTLLPKMVSLFVLTCNKAKQNSAFIILVSLIHGIS